MKRESPPALKAVVFDWAGTVLDFGSLAPMGAFVQLFRRYDIALSVAQARVPMGLPKWDHIKALGSMPEIGRQWLEIYGHPFGDADVDELYAAFTPMNAASVKDHAALIPGVLDTVAALRERKLKIGSTTGYNRPIMEVLAPLAAAQGYVPDNLVCAGDLPAGRPSPLMMYRTFADLGVWPPETVVKVDDTAPGIAEALAAGCWAVGVAVSGNAVGLDLASWQALTPAEQATYRAQAHADLRAAGAHEVVDSVADLLPALERLQARAGTPRCPTPRSSEAPPVHPEPVEGPRGASTGSP